MANKYKEILIGAKTANHLSLFDAIDLLEEALSEIPESIDGQGESYSNPLYTKMENLIAVIKDISTKPFLSGYYWCYVYNKKWLILYWNKDEGRWYHGLAIINENCISKIIRDKIDKPVEIE